MPGGRRRSPEGIMAGREGMTVSQWLDNLRALIRAVAVSIVRRFDPVVAEREAARLEDALTVPGARRTAAR
jgi:hypothetical protein